MILLPLLALLPLLHSSQAEFCPADAACLHFALCNGVIDKVQFFDSEATSFDDHRCPIVRDVSIFDIPSRESFEMRFRPIGANELSVRLTSRNMRPHDDIEFSMNEVRFKFSNETSVAVTGVAATSCQVSMESASGGDFAGNITMTTREPPYISFANLTVHSANQTWELPGFSQRLMELAPCDSSDLVQACEKPDCQFTIDDAGRKVVCAGDAKKLWMLSSAPNEWSNIDQIICKNVQWTASDHALPAPIKTVCHETNPAELFCFDDLSKACADEKKCDLVVTPTRVTCASTLRINTASNPFYRNWVAGEIFCHNERWNWLSVNDTGKPTPVGDRKISCSVEALGQGTALLSWTIGGSIGAFFVIFFAIAACCYLRAKRKAMNDGRSRTTNKETSLGVLPSSQRVVAPKSWHWPENESKRALVSADAPSRDVTGPNERAEFGTRSHEDKSATVEATTFSGKSSKKK